jgi:Tfp pilus assembly protein PilW
MFGLIARVRERAADERGFSLLEMTIVVGLLMVVLTIFLNILWSVQNGVTRQSERSTSNDQARLALEQLDRQIRSGDVIQDPGSVPSSLVGTDVAAGYMLVIYTQTAPGEGNPNQCVQWMINTKNQLLERTWDVDWQNNGTYMQNWRLVASNVVNRSVSPAQPAFQYATSGGATNLFGQRAVQITIMTQQNAHQGIPVSITNTVTGRNTQYGYPANVCLSPPAYPTTFPNS